MSVVGDKNQSMGFRNKRQISTKSDSDKKPLDTNIPHISSLFKVILDICASLFELVDLFQTINPKLYINQ